jgi:hypothetical protein
MKKIAILIIISVFGLSSLFAQNKINGLVTDSEGTSLKNVLITGKGSEIETKTKEDGTYEITVSPYVNTLIFSLEGYKTVEKEITSGLINVFMSLEGIEKDSIKTEVIELIITDPESGADVAYETVTVGSVSGVKTDRKIRIKGFAKKSRSESYKPVTDYDVSEYSDELLDDTDTGNEVSSGLLTAGELNDYGKWELWKDISDNQLKTYKTIWKMMPQQRYCVQVTNYADRPVTNAQVFLTDSNGDTIWSASTDNTGKAELWLNMFDSLYSAKDLTIDVRNDNQSFKLNNAQKFHDGMNFINIPADCNIPDEADIAFVVDATGSMGDEIAYLKAELEDVLSKIKKQHKDIKVNTASVFYRDNTDAYLVRKSDFTEDIKTTTEFIRSQSAGGGGDFPEAVDAGLHTAINELSWSDNALTKVVFLILDAPPHGDAASIQKIQDLTKKAASKGIRIVPITASGIDKSTEYLMRSIALATNGTYVFLTDHSGIGNDHIEPTTDEYQVELLNDVFTRLIDQYLTVPECEEEIVYDEEEIQDTAFINDPILENDSTNTENNGTVITEITPPGKVKYYPNPTVDILNIEISGEMKEMFLADISGKILQRFDIENQKTFRISLAKYPSGIYFIQYMNGERWQTGKVIHTTVI